jgi:hypothetical protein
MNKNMKRTDARKIALNPAQWSDGILVAAWVVLNEYVRVSGSDKCAKDARTILAELDTRRVAIPAPE